MKDMHIAAAILILSLLTSVFAQEKDGPPPSEKAAKRLAVLLQPGEMTGGSFSSQPLPRAGTWWIEHPQAPLSVFPGTPPRILAAPIPRAAPTDPREEPPLAGYRTEPAPPFAVELPAGYLVRLPAIDVSQPLALPILAQPLRDHASLVDPTYDTSVAVALAQVQATRIAAVPFTPINLPDPFENSHAVQLRLPLEENPLPPLVTPRPPQK